MKEEQAVRATILPEFLDDLLSIDGQKPNWNNDNYKLQFFILGSLVIAKRHTRVIGKFCDGILLTFGATESCLVAAKVLTNDRDYKVGEVGHPLPGVSLLIVDKMGNVAKRKDGR